MQNIITIFFIKYVGVQSWKATHLPTLEIRVEQKGRLQRQKREKKWKINCCHCWESNPEAWDNCNNIFPSSSHTAVLRKIKRKHLRGEFCYKLKLVLASLRFARTE